MLRTLRSVRTPVVAALFSALALTTAAPAAAQSSDDVRYVSLGGRDGRRPACEGGTASDPWRTIEHGMRCLQRGETLYVRGGTYRERVLPVLTDTGTPSEPITVAAYPGETVLVEGLIRLERADHWVLDGINVTNDGQPYGSGEYLVKFRDGVGWIFRNADVWDASSYAAVRVESSSGSTREPADWRITGSCIAKTRATHAPYQDHNLYVSTAADSGPGRIDRNLLFGAPNGQNIKLGGGSESALTGGRVDIEYNTLWRGVQNLLAEGGVHDVTVRRNILGDVIRPAGKSWYPSVRGYELTGNGNVVTDNLGHLAAGANFIFNDRGSTPGWRDGGGNRVPVDPAFDDTTSCNRFRARSTAARYHGHDPLEPTPRSTDGACPEDEVPPSGFTDVSDRNVHAHAIDCVAWHDIASGTGGGRYSPGGRVTRGQMAQFVRQTLVAAGVAMPEDPPDAFTDDDGHLFEDAIDELAALDVVGGTGDGRYRPGAGVSREAMATYLNNAHEAATGSRLGSATDWFTDDDGSVHETNIDGSAGAGLVAGSEPGTYAPAATVRRDQMATFLVRLLDVLVR